MKKLLFLLLILIEANLFAQNIPSAHDLGAICGYIESIYGYADKRTGEYDLNSFDQNTKLLGVCIDYCIAAVYLGNRLNFKESLYIAVSDRNYNLKAYSIDKKGLNLTKKQQDNLVEAFTQQKANSLWIGNHIFVDSALHGKIIQLNYEPYVKVFSPTRKLLNNHAWIMAYIQQEGHILLCAVDINNSDAMKQLLMSVEGLDGTINYFTYEK